MTKTSHTPTPWVHDSVPTSCGVCIRIGSREQLDTPKSDRSLIVPSYACLYVDYGNAASQAEENAEFIVRACNNHDDLIKALLDFAEIAANAKPNCGPKLRASIQAAQEKHSEIITKAKGE